MKRYTLPLFALLLLTVSCHNRGSVADAFPGAVWPDIDGTTVPCNIAPLNFSVADPSLANAKVTAQCGQEVLNVRARKGEVTFPLRAWHRLLAGAEGQTMTITVGTQLTLTLQVAEPVDDYVTYRKMAPGYEVYSHIGIYQRRLTDYDEEPILESTALPGQCMGCHTANRTSPDTYMFHVRGEHGGTLVQRDGHHEWLTTKTDSTMGNVAYTAWHPDGRYFAGSINPVRQAFWTGKEHLIEVFDLASDIVLMDMDTHELILSPLLMSPMRETTPVFSADGSRLYFCRAGEQTQLAELPSLRYELCSIAFDAATGTLGDSIETVLSDSLHSFTFPRTSYDGRWLMYCRTDFSCFPIDHKEADLWLLDLQTGATRPLDEVNSDCSESFHNWSSNSRWFLFSSRRGDGLHGRLYLAHIDAEGRVGKPFLLPQRHPRQFYEACFQSFNVPDFSSGRVRFDARAAYGEVFGDERVQAVVRK